MVSPTACITYIISFLSFILYTSVCMFVPFYTSHLFLTKFPINTLLWICILHSSFLTFLQQLPLFVFLFFIQPVNLFFTWYFSFLSSLNSPANLIHSLRKMGSNQLHSQVACMRENLFKQGYLDEQFIQLEELQDDANPNFVEEVVTLFFRDSTRLIFNIEQALDKAPLDFNKLDTSMHQFKGSSSSIGARKVKNECTQFKEYCRQGNGEGCLRTFQQVKREYATLRKKLEMYFQLARQAGPAEMACRPR